MNDPRGWYSRGYLPHFDSPETLQHIVFRTADSLPPHLQTQTHGARERVQIFDALLDEGRGEGLLAAPGPAKILETALLHFDGERYRLLAWCVMPNHVHALVEQTQAWPLAEIVKSWKAFSAAQINRTTRRRGSFWARDYFDRYMRNEAQLEQTIAYIENNPIKAGLCASPTDWPFSSARRRT